jgi:hypothetical protein
MAYRAQVSHVSCTQLIAYESPNASVLTNRLREITRVHIVLSRSGHVRSSLLLAFEQISLVGLVGAGKSVRSDLRPGFRAIIGYPGALAREPFLLLEQLPARHAAASSAETSAPLLWSGERDRPRQQRHWPHSCAHEWGRMMGCVSGGCMHRLSAVAGPAMHFVRVAPGPPAYAVRFVARHQEPLLNLETVRRP